jgi:hypothetical protein
MVLKILKWNIIAYHAGPVSFSITQLFAKVILDIPHALLVAVEEQQEKNDTLHPKLDVEISENAIILKNSLGNVAIEVGTKEDNHIHYFFIFISEGVCCFN